MNNVCKCTEDADQIRVFLMDEKILDSERIRQFGAEIARVIEYAKSQRKRIVLDLGRVTFMSSAMITELVQVNKSTKAFGIPWRLANVTPNVMEVFKITKLTKRFPFNDGEDKGPGGAGVAVRPPKPPKTDSGHANGPTD